MRFQTPDHAARGIDTILNMLLSVPIFHPVTGHEDPALAALPHANRPCNHCTGGGVVPRTSLNWNRISNAHTRIKPQTIRPTASIYTHVKKVYRGSRVQLHTSTSNRWTSVVNFTLQSFQSRERTAVPLNRGLGVPQKPSEQYGEETKFCPNHDSNPDHPAGGMDAIPTMLTRPLKLHPRKRHVGPGPCHFTPKKKPCTHGTGDGWTPGVVWTRAENLMCPHQNSISRPSSP
jgi:hypothetical protein